MSLIIDKPEGLRSSNDLDAIPTDILDAPPAYLWFGTSPCAVENPPEIDDDQPGLFDEAGNPNTDDEDQDDLDDEGDD